MWKFYHYTTRRPHEQSEGVGHLPEKPRWHILLTLQNGNGFNLTCCSFCVPHAPVVQGHFSSLCIGEKVCKTKTEDFALLTWYMYICTHRMRRADDKKHGLHVTGGTAQVGKDEGGEKAVHREKEGLSSKRTRWTRFNKFLPSSFPHPHLYSRCITSATQFLARAHTQL